ncbi:type IV pilus biogenesis protein PilM [Pseudomonas extremorientalis]|uniref:type IV pilus biogenesis protein PilM n=1 Tax=Pseudomonas extremorientalis TaxID=169669 RepID=UPI0027324A0B|nr:type IV pilus biogenesis protein PilM [Pseudomonas extremorientalis]WLG57752.1 type IV pilus biogenesis protein PilM [Pseudomonas extremorientalis]
MSIHWAVLAILLIAMGLINQQQKQSEQLTDYATIDSLSRNLLVYRSAAAEYAKANTGFTGTPTDEALNLPAWFSKPSGVTTYVSAGQSYTYFAGIAPSGLPAALVERTQSITVGVNRAGVLISPISGQTDVLLPKNIPEGAVVAVN